jgi:DNA mismatch repair ATPase MutS
MQSVTPPEKYRLLAERNNLLCLKQKKILFTLSILRLLVFAGGAGLGIAGFSFSLAAGIISTVFTFILFLFLLNRYEIHSERKEFFANLEIINLNEINALSGDLSPFNNGSRWINSVHDFSNDIDLFGSDSLFQFLNRTVTGQGRETLARWLAEPYEISGETKSRQATIAELSSKHEWRQEFMAQGIGKSLEKEDIEGLLDWLNDKSRFLSSPILKIAIWLFPGLALSSLILLIAGYIHYSVFIIFFFMNLLLVLREIRKTGKIHIQVSKKYSFLSSLSRLLSSFEKETFNSVILSDIKNKISTGDLSAVKRIKKLSRIIQSFDSRLNLLVGFALNGLLLWDFHCIRSLEKWKEESKKQFPEWLNKIGEIDALISLANFAFNNPGYAYPGFSREKTIFSASNMGHPLINHERRVCNDFVIPDKGKVFIITGANMAGKSTFLRTVAVNFILAMIGAPVCANELKFNPLKLFTSMRTTDSLTQNESYFYAELKRLKTLKTRLEEGQETLFILDEILKGTNSVDKSNGSRLFMKKIVDLGGTGLIATHDTSLGDMENEFPGLIINKCFEIEIDGENISFDYKLQEGITRKMNAALLMKQMGIT